ncbi:MAG: hypothetical protein ACR2NK_19200 [Mariniblastus sp.]
MARRTKPSNDGLGGRRKSNNFQKTIRPVYTFLPRNISTLRADCVREMPLNAAKHVICDLCGHVADVNTNENPVQI